MGEVGGCESSTSSSAILPSGIETLVSTGHEDGCVLDRCAPKLGGGGFCGYDDIKRFTCFTLQLKFATEIS